MRAKKAITSYKGSRPKQQEFLVHSIDPQEMTEQRDIDGFIPTVYRPNHPCVNPENVQKIKAALPNIHFVLGTDDLGRTLVHLDPEKFSFPFQQPDFEEVPLTGDYVDVFTNFIAAANRDVRELSQNLVAYLFTLADCREWALASTIGQQVAGALSAAQWMQGRMYRRFNEVMDFLDACREEMDADEDLAADEDPIV